MNNYNIIANETDQRRWLPHNILHVPLRGTLDIGRAVYGNAFAVSPLQQRAYVVVMCYVIIAVCGRKRGSRKYITENTRSYPQGDRFMSEKRDAYNNDNNDIHACTNMLCVYGRTEHAIKAANVETMPIR